jgi:DNA-binding phage protein
LNQSDNVLAEEGCEGEMAKRLLTKQEVVLLLRQRIEQSTEAVFAYRADMDRESLDRMLQGRKAPSPGVLQALGLRRIKRSGVSKQALLEHLRRDIRQAGGISAWSRRTGIDQSVVTRVLTGQHPPGPSFDRALDAIYRALNLRREILYVTEDDEGR